MKIAFLLYKYFPYGGMQRDFRRFVEECQALGHQCRVYCVSWQGDLIEDAELRQVPVKALTNRRRNERYHQWVRRDLAADPVGGVVGFNKMPGLDVYYAADSCFRDKAFKERNWMYRAGARYRHFAAYEEAVFGRDSRTEILLISETEKSKFLDHYNTQPERLHMLPPGISRDRCAGDDAPARRRHCREELQLEADEVALLFIGSGFMKKGLDRAISSVAALTRAYPRQQLKLFVVGQDKERRFRGLAGALDVADKVVFMGGRDDIPELLLGADALIHPALDEAAGIVLLEALVAGLPAIVTDVCGYAHHIAAASAGIVLPTPFAQTELNEAVEQCLDRPFREACRKNGLNYASAEDLYSMHTTGAKLITQFIERGGTRG